mgnify:CR=1 FL=1
MEEESLYQFPNSLPDHPAGFRRIEREERVRVGIKEVLMIFTTTVLINNFRFALNGMSTTRNKYKRGQVILHRYTFEPITFWEMVWRRGYIAFWVNYIGLFTFGILNIWFLKRHEEGMTLGDVVSKTIVVYHPNPAENIARDNLFRALQDDDIVDRSIAAIMGSEDYLKDPSRAVTKGYLKRDPSDIPPPKKDLE